VKAATERWLLQRWYGGQAPGFGLRLLAGVYHLGLKSRAALRPRRVPGEQRLAVPVIVVGNFTAGGTGKTPLVIALVEHLKLRGYRPGVVSRGYGRASTKPVLVTAETSAEQCGDEPRLVFERTGVPVRVDRKRLDAALALIADGCDVVIADDGLQHVNLPRDIEIEMLDGERRYGNGLLIPAGPLREIPRPVDARVVNGGAAQAGEWAMRLQLADAVAIDGNERRPLETFRETAIDAVAGIGNPGRFFSALGGVGLTIREHGFPDHHQYRREDFSALPGPILMTEKDAVKCRGLGLRNAWAVPVQAELPLDFFRLLNDKLDRLLPKQSLND
jgi:tetraacyldisaccharide 4'-kinase